MVLGRRRYLEFEKPLQDLDEQIAKLKELKLQGNVDISSEIRDLEEKALSLSQSISKGLNAYQKVQISRHPDRPNFLGYVKLIFDDFMELHGDRNFRDDPSIVGGLSQFNGQSVMLIGHQKGQNTQENMLRNFGMPRPEGYRKALRLMNLAERLRIPVLTFVDTPGAYPGLDAEERGQAEAIAKNIMVMSGLKVPILTTILGEGGSGGALAIAVCDRLMMMEYSTYSVISPEGCAAITWKDGKFAEQAAEALRLTASQVLDLGVADLLVPEAAGGAHRDRGFSAQNLKEAIEKNLPELMAKDVDQLLDERYEKFRRMGSLSGEASDQTKNAKRNRK